MLLRRVTKHVKEQNWTAVTLDFVIVVIGVVVGLQFSNWNENRADSSAYVQATGRLAEESANIFHYSLDTSNNIERQLNRVQAAILALETCSTNKQSAMQIDQGLNSVRGTIGLSAHSDALELLVKEDSLVRQQAPNQRETLRSYSQTINRLNDVSRRVQEGYPIQEIEMHPLIAFTGIIAPEETNNGIDIRRARLAVPPEQACADSSFSKAYYWWERGHVYQLYLHSELRKTILEHNEALGLPTSFRDPL